jgi:hypothetical protein
MNILAADRGDSDRSLLTSDGDYAEDRDTEERRSSSSNSNGQSTRGPLLDNFQPFETPNSNSGGGNSRLNGSVLTLLTLLPLTISTCRVYFSI